MFSCGKKKHKKQSDLSNVAKMAEAIDDDINNSGRQNKSNVTVVGNVSINDGNHSGNGDSSCLNSINGTNNRTTAINRNQNSRRSIQRFSCSRCCNDIFNYLMRFRASPEEVEQRIKSREIDRYLEKDKHTFRRQVRFRSHESTSYVTDDRR